MDEKEGGLGRPNRGGVHWLLGDQAIGVVEIRGIVEDKIILLRCHFVRMFTMRKQYLDYKAHPRFGRFESTENSCILRFQKKKKVTHCRNEVCFFKDFNISFIYVKKRFNSVH